MLATCLQHALPSNHFPQLGFMFFVPIPGTDESAKDTCEDVSPKGKTHKINIKNTFIFSVFSLLSKSMMHDDAMTRCAGFKCSTATACSSCAGQMEDQQVGSSLYCYWCASSRQCVNEQQWSEDEQCPMFLFTRDTCPESANGAQGTSSTTMSTTSGGGSGSGDEVARRPEKLSEAPTSKSTLKPSLQPSLKPTLPPSAKTSPNQPTNQPTGQPTVLRTDKPTAQPTHYLNSVFDHAFNPMTTVSTTTTSTKVTSNSDFWLAQWTDVDAGPCQNFDSCASCAGHTFIDSYGEEVTYFFNIVMKIIEQSSFCIVAHQRVKQTKLHFSNVVLYRQDSCFWCAGESACISTDQWESNHVCNEWVDSQQSCGISFLC